MAVVGVRLTDQLGVALVAKRNGRLHEFKAIACPRIQTTLEMGLAFDELLKWLYVLRLRK